MHSFAIAFAAAASIGAASHGPTRAAAATGLIRDTVLANGLTVIVAENHSVPIATVQVVVRTGAFTQAPGEEGISHLYEHLLFRAYGPDQRFGLEVADMRGYYNGATAEEEVDYYVTAPSKAVPTSIRMLAKLVISPAFRDADLAAERGIVKAEFERNASETDFEVQRELHRRLWGADWSRRDPLGTAESIDRIPMARLRDVYARYYVPANAALVVAGDVDAREVFAQAAQRFGDWKNGGSDAARPASLSAEGLHAPEVFAVSSARQRLVNLTLAWPGPRAREEPAATRAAAAFADMVNSALSPLSERLLSTGLAQSVEFEYTPRNLGGPMTLSIVMLPGAVERALPIIRAEIDRFGTPAYVNDTLFNAARAAQAVDAEFSAEHSAALAQALASAWARVGRAGYRAELSPESSPTLADIAAFVNDRLTGHSFVAGALTSPADLERVRRAMTTWFGPGGSR